MKSDSIFSNEEFLFILQGEVSKYPKRYIKQITENDIKNFLEKNFITYDEISTGENNTCFFVDKDGRTYEIDETDVWDISTVETDITLKKLWLEFMAKKFGENFIFYAKCKLYLELYENAEDERDLAKKHLNEKFDKALEKEVKKINNKCKALTSFYCEAMQNALHSKDDSQQ